MAGNPGCQKNKKIPQPRRGPENLAAADSVNLLTQFDVHPEASITEQGSFALRN